MRGGGETRGKGGRGREKEKPPDLSRAAQNEGERASKPARLTLGCTGPQTARPKPRGGSVVHNQTIPTVLEIPSKEHPYDPEQDYIMQRVNMFLGGQG